MLRQGINPKVFQGGLGHGSISVMLDINGHRNLNLQQEAARKFDAILSPQNRTAID